MNPQVKNYLVRLLLATVRGCAHSVSAWLGLAAGHSLSADVPTLNWKAMGCVMLTSSVVAFFRYIDTTDMSQFITKNDAETAFLKKSDVQQPPTQQKP